MRSDIPLIFYYKKLLQIKNVFPCKVCFYIFQKFAQNGGGLDFKR